MKKVYVLFLLIFGFSGILSAQISITATGSYSQDFSSLPSTGSVTWTDNSTIANWYAQRTGTGNTVVASNGGSGTGALYSFGTGTATERALGSVGSGTPGHFAWGAHLQNNSGSPITDIRITYTGEQWRNSAAAAQTVSFYYKISSSPISLLNPNVNTTWTAVSALNFTSPITGGVAAALDGNSAANRTTFTNIAIPGLALAAGEYIMIKWEDPDHTGTDHGLSIDDLTINWTVGGATPDIALSSPNPAVAAGNISQGTTNNVIYRFDLAVTSADATVNGVTINTAGTYAATDVTNFKVWYSSDNIFNAGSDVLLSTKTTSLGSGTHVFPAFTNQAITNGTTGYFFITTDIPCTAVIANDIFVNAITTADISVVTGNKTGTAFAGGLQTIVVATPNNVNTPAASVANASSTLTWANPTGCFDEVLIVARASSANDGVPTGDGTAYTASNVFGTGTALGNGFVVYKGTANTETVTGLTNGTPYYYKFFTRLGTTWSSGVEVNATPAIVTLSTDYFRSVTSGAWNVTATWESSSDSSTWIPATLVPGAAAAHVVIQSPDSVWLADARTTANLTILSGAKMNANAFVMSATVRFNLLGTASFYQGGTVTLVPGVQQVLSTTSNYHYNGTQAGTSPGAYPEFGNLYWEPTASGNGTFQNNVTAAPFNNGLVVRGDMTINIQGATPREVRFGSGATVLRRHTIDGDLNIIGPSSIAVIQNGTVGIFSAVDVGGDLNVSGGATLRGVNSTAEGILNLSGHINNNGGIIQTGGGTANFSINYVGTLPQTINNTGGTFTFAANQRDTINNTAVISVTLNTPITHFGNIHFDDGFVFTSAVNLLTMGAGSSVSGGSDESFVLGPMKKIGNTNFVFPIGKENGIIPIGISTFTGASAVTDEFTAEYIRSSAAALGPVTAPFITRVSSCEYWSLVLNNGTPTIDVTLYWRPNNSCGTGPYITDVPTLEAARFDGANWSSSSIGVSSKNGNGFNGDITWTGGLSTFGNFTLASSSAANPLPVTINYFNGTKQNGDHLLNWKVTCISTPSATMELERSTDGRTYNSIYNVFATAVECQQPFSYTDNNPAKGVNYYRLKMTDADGKVTYSSIVPLINGTKGIEIMNISPNPIVNGAFNLKLSTAEKMQVELVIVDMQGRVMMRQSANTVAGFNTIPMNVRQLATGTYQLYGNTAEGRTKVMRFVVQ